MTGALTPVPDWRQKARAKITPIEMTLRGALAGNHVQARELFDLMEDSWPRLEIREALDATPISGLGGTLV